MIASACGYSISDMPGRSLGTREAVLRDVAFKHGFTGEASASRERPRWLGSDPTGRMLSITGRPDDVHEITLVGPRSSTPGSLAAELVQRYAPDLVESFRAAVAEARVRSVDERETKGERRLVVVSYPPGDRLIVTVGVSQRESTPIPGEDPP